MNVIFLDIDGVLNSHASVQRYEKVNGDYRHSMTPDETHVECLNKIVNATGAKVVISSTWRILSDARIIGMLLSKCGFKGHVIDVTPRIHNKERGDEIQAWLDEHLDRKDSLMQLSLDDAWEPVDNFVILDDSGDMAHLQDKLVQTTFDDGLLDIHVEQAIQLLNGG